MPRIDITIEKRGAIFRLPQQQVSRARQRAIKELVEYGEQELDKRLRPRPAGVYLSVEQARPGEASTGNYRRHVHGRVENLRGIIDDGNVVYGPWLEGISSRNQTTRFKGYASFRRTSEAIQKRAKPVLRSHVDRLVRSLNT